MATKTIPYHKLTPLVRDYLSGDDDKTLALIRDLRPIRTRRYLTPTELEKVCRWKSARALRYIRSNSAGHIRRATTRAFATRSERRRLEALRELRGVSIPMASAILMLVDPKRYGVIDIRVWQLLYAIGAVAKKPNGVNFTFANWHQFLMIVRYFAKQFGVKARDVERAFFKAHKDYQKGRLYRES